MEEYLPVVSVILRDKLVTELMQEVQNLRRRLEVAESLTIFQQRREIAVGVLAEGVDVSDNEWTIDLEQSQHHDGHVCLLTDLLKSEICLGRQQSTPLRIANVWRSARWIAWRLTDDLVLIEMAHADFSIRFTTVLEPHNTEPVLRNAGLLSILHSPQMLTAERLASPEHPIAIYLTTLHVRVVSDWMSLL